jgi:N-acetyl-anhydromuramyl-L-alanine amidase AmpD
MIVLHSTAGRKASDLDILTDDSVPLKKRVSAHYYILKTGHVYQLVPEQYAAWHSGVAQWGTLGSVKILEGSIGIELENLNNGIDPYPPEQYNALLELVTL